jgi:hypothetical protein
LAPVFSCSLLHEFQVPCMPYSCVSSSNFFHASPKLIPDMSLLYATVLPYWKRWFCNIFCILMLLVIDTTKVLRRYFVFCNVIWTQSEYLHPLLCMTCLRS